MVTIQEVLSFNLRELRGNQSMADFAESAGMPYRTYQSIEGGERWPRLENLEAIAKALNVPVTRLFRDPTLQATPQEALAVLGKALNMRGNPPRTVPPDDWERLLSALENDPSFFDDMIAPILEGSEPASNQAKRRTRG